MGDEVHIDETKTLATDEEGKSVEGDETEDKAPETDAETEAETGEE